MSGFWMTLAILLALLAICAAALCAAAAFDSRMPILGACLSGVAVLGTALLVTWAVGRGNRGAGRCGPGTVRVEHRVGKALEYICEVQR